MHDDEITIIKKDGSELEKIRASVQNNKTFIESQSIVVDSGDIIKRFLSNGAEEFYKVINPQFYEKMGPIGAHYQIEHKKLGLEEIEKIYKVELTNPEKIAPELKEIASYLAKLTDDQKEVLKLLADKNDILDEIRFLKADEITLMKMEFSKLKESGKNGALPWETIETVISIVTGLSSLI